MSEALGSILANTTETQYLIFLKELSHGFKKPIQALLHTPALNTQRCVLCIHLCHLLSILIAISRKYPAGTSTGIRKPDPDAMWHHSREDKSHQQSLTCIYLLNLRHPITFCAHLQKSDLLTTSLFSNLLGKLIFSSFPPSA